MTDGVPHAMYDFTVLRSLRQREGLSIADMSERSGVSPSVISKLERNQSLANLETLYRVGRVFGMTPSDLLALTESASAHRRTETGHTNHGIQFREITYGNLRCLLGHAPAGSATEHPQIHSDNYEICWLISGRLVFHLPHEELTLTAGDAIQFDGILDHRYEALEESRFLLIHLQKSKRF
jgi:transcriptional regulator with XRE-family HTH domain